MGLRGRPLSQHGRRPRAVATRWALAVTALVTVTMLGLTPAALANAGSETSWWDDHPRPQPPTSVTHETGWLDVLDLGASVRAGSQTGIGAGVTLRVRLDAKAHLARLRAEAEDLAAITAALARHRDLGAALAWLAGRCLGHWRAWQLQLLDALLQTGTAGGGHDLDHAYLGALRDLHALDATRPAGAADVRACRLTEPLASLAFAADHPQVVSAAAERSLGERTQALMAAPAPPSLWFSADGRAGGGRGLVVDVRFGLDVPLAAGAAAVDVTLASDGGGAYHARLGFQRAGAARARHPVSRSEPAQDDTGRLERELRDGAERRLFEARLLRLEADRAWLAVCGATDAEAIVTCLTWWPSDGLRVLDGLRTIEAELVAARAALAAIDAAGGDLAALLGVPSRGEEAPAVR
jgi:hypothetical protein